MKTELIYGVHAVTALVKHHPERIRQFYLVQEKPTAALRAVLALASRYGIRVQHAKRDTLTQRCQSSQHQGVFCEITPQKLGNEADVISHIETLAHNPLLLILDSVQDPHNLGACFRSADALNVDAVVFTRHQSAGLSGVVHKVACGATQVLSLFQVTNLARVLNHLKKLGIWVTGTALEKELPVLYEVDFKGPSALVLGGEGQGLRRLTAQLCDQSVRIPMQGSVQSLNVSAAAAVCLYEVFRQRQC